MSFYENNRAGNAVLSAFPGKILQKTAIKKEPPGPLVRGIPGGSCCYVVAAGASLANLVLDVLVGLIALDSSLREGVVIPPVDKRGDCGDTSSHQLFHRAALDGQRRLAERAQNLVCQSQQQGSGTGDGGGGNFVIVLYNSILLSFDNGFDSATGNDFPLRVFDLGGII